MDKPVPRIIAGPKRCSTVVPPLPRVVRTALGALSIGAVALCGVGCAARPASVAEPSRPRITTSAGITCTEWSRADSANAGVEPIRDEVENTVVIKVVVHLMQAVGHKTERLWDEGKIRDIFGWQGQVNTIWGPDIRLRLDRIEDCRYSPKGLRLDGRDQASLFVPLLRSPQQWRDPDDASLNSLKPEKSPLLSLATTVEALDQQADRLRQQGDYLLSIVREHAPGGPDDERVRIRALDDLRTIGAELADIGTSINSQAGELGRGELGKALGDQKQTLSDVQDILAKITSNPDDPDLSHAGLKQIVGKLNPIEESLTPVGGLMDSASRQALRSFAGSLHASADKVSHATGVLWVLQTQPRIGTSLAQMRNDLEKIEQWASKHDIRYRQIREAGHLFRSVNGRFAAFDPDALHVVLWWAINDLDSQFGYGRAVGRGGPAVWADRRCLREKGDECGRLFAHEVGHVLTLKHVCLGSRAEPNVDELPSCNSDQRATVVEGCRVQPKNNLMHPEYDGQDLERCQRAQAAGEGRSQFNH